MASGAGAAAIRDASISWSRWVRSARTSGSVTSTGLVHEGRNTTMDRWKAVYREKTDKRTLADVIGGADIFIGLLGTWVCSSRQHGARRWATSP